MIDLVNRRWWRRIARRTFRGAHVTDGVLIPYVDGEVDARLSAQIDAHLKACWSCRQRKAEIEQGIADFVVYWRRCLEEEDSERPHARIRFQAALREAAGQDAPEQGSSERLSWLWRPVEWTRISAVRRAVATGAIVAGIVTLTALAVLIGPGHVKLSGAQVVQRADARLAGLVKPGQVLYRRWHSQVLITPASGTPRGFEQTYEEWAEGAIPNRLAARGRLADGRIASTVWTIPENGALRVFRFKPEGLEALASKKAGDEFPAVFSMPTGAELRKEVSRYPESEWRSFDGLLAFEPVVDDRVTYSFLTRGGQAWSRESSTEHVTLSDGRPALRVTFTMPSGLLVDYVHRHIDVVPATMRATFTFAADSYLLQETDRCWNTNDGRVIRSMFRVDALRVVPASDVAEVFSFTPPPGTPTIRIPAAELVKAVRRVVVEPPLATGVVQVGEAPPKVPSGRR